MKFCAEKKRIVYVQYTNPAAYPPLERSSRLLADAGWDVLVLGLVRPGTETLRFPAHARISERYLFSDATGWRLKLHYAWFVAWALVWTLRWRTRWVYASDVLSCPMGLLLSFMPNVRIVYHEHDEPAARHGVSAQAQQVVRRLIARRATVRVLPNAARARFFEQTAAGGRPTLRVWNCPCLAEVGPPRTGVDDNGHVLRLVYSGAVTPERLPPTVLEAMAQISACVRLQVIGYETAGYPGYVERLRQTAQQLGIARQVEIISALPRYRLHELWCASDVGLALSPMAHSSNNSRWLVGASNKPFDYMANGLALIVSDLEEWRETFVRSGFGIACDANDPVSLASALHWLSEHPAERQAMGERGRQQIATQWNYESQFMPVMAQLGALQPS
jgi:glycosyltransferase involved in cell wall biosynthesis